MLQMIAAMVSGVLFRKPETRIAKNGNQFTVATMREGSGDEVRWVNIVAFGELAQAELSRLSAGDHVTIQGPFRAEIYEANGEPRVALKITADAVLALRRERQSPARKPADARKAEALSERDERRAGKWQSPADGPNDLLDCI
jgi:single-stranded DNA-binding protein